MPPVWPIGSNTVVLMGIRITGVDLPVVGGGVSWEYTEGDNKVARAVVTFLEDRRVLFGDRHCEDEAHCIRSAIAIRRFLTEQIAAAKPGKDLEGCLRSMRAACRRFVEAGGPDGSDFFANGRYYRTADLFGLALGDLRTSIGHQLAVVLRHYPIEIEEELASILPAVDRD